MLRIGLLTRGHNIDQGYRWVTGEPLYQPWKEYADKGLLNTDGVSAMAWQSGGSWGVLLCGVPTLRPMWLGDICTCMLSLQGVGTSAEYREITLSIKILELWLADIAADPFNLRLDRIVSPQASVLGRHMYKTISDERAQKLFALPQNKSEHLWQHEMEQFLKSLEHNYSHSTTPLYTPHMVPYHSALALSPRTWYQGAIMSSEDRATFIEQVHHLLHAGTHGVALFCNGADPGSFVDKAGRRNISDSNRTASTPGPASAWMGNGGDVALMAVLTKSSVSHSTQPRLRSYLIEGNPQEPTEPAKVPDIGAVTNMSSASITSSVPSASSVLSVAEYSGPSSLSDTVQSAPSDGTSDPQTYTGQESSAVHVRSTWTKSTQSRLPRPIQTPRPSEGFVAALWGYLQRLAQHIHEYIAKHFQ